MAKETQPHSEQPAVVPASKRAEELGVILAHQLKASLESDLGVFDGEMRREIAGAGTSGGRSVRTFQDALSHPRVPLAILQRIKEYAKRKLDDYGRATPPAVLTVLYYAAIAAALVHLRKRITRLDDAQLRVGFRWGTKLSWVDNHTRALFDSALRKVL